MKKILITGVAGFIGFHLAKRLLNKGQYKVIGVDIINSYYSIKLKKDRINILKKIGKKNFIFFKINICNKKKLEKIFLKYNFENVIHLAAQAGVRHAFIKPQDYFDNNIIGFYNILDLSKKKKIKHLIAASTSSVYGLVKKLPFSASHPTGLATQFYAASKKSNEIMAHSYSYMFNMPITILRFFSVYGPWGRPDMALFLFVKNIINKKKIFVFNKGNHSRDFTYIDDIIDGICLAINKIPKKKFFNNKKTDFSTSKAPFKILNLGNGRRVTLLNYIKIIEKNLQKKAKIKYLGFQQGDIINSLANIKDTQKYLNYQPKINIEKGVKYFIEWFLEYYKKGL